MTNHHCGVGSSPTYAPLGTATLLSDFHPQAGSIRIFANRHDINRQYHRPSMNFPRIVLSSRNKKKIEEIAELMEPHGISLVGVSSFVHVPEVIEDADSFAGNAAKKASEVARQLGEWTIADDSGLCVDALKGAPGIYSARYADAPHPGSLEADECNNQKLLRELADVPTAQRTAHYVCAVALADPQGQIRVATEGRCHGRILREYHGINGFGYDPMFLVPEFHKSFGELSPAVKRHISHRAKAFERAMPQIVRLFETL